MTTVTEDATPNILDDNAIETSYGFDLQGRTRAQLTFAPGDTDTSITTSYLYDSLGRLDVMTDTDTDSDSNVTASYDYEVRADGRRTGSTETFWIDENEDGIQTANELKANSYSWSYDGLNRLTDEVIDHWDNAFDQTESYTYDATGNRTRVERLSQSSQESIEYRYDANDRLFAELTDDQTSENADTTTIYGYDHTQQTEKTVYTDLLDETTIASLVSGADDSSFKRVSSQTFVYNLQGRMSEAVVDKYNAVGTLDTREKSSYEYDMRSFRVGQTAETWNESTGEFEFKSNTEFLVSHRNHTGYAQTLRETTTNADGSTKSIDYTFGADEISQRVVERDDQGNVTNDQTLVFGHDGHGSVRVLYDLALTASSLIVQIVAYSSYGVQIAMHSGDGAVMDSALSSKGYASEHFDASIQKSYNNARWYDPRSVQWNRLDPFVGNNQDPQSLHKYAYVHGDPISGVDPTGLYLAASFSSVGLSSGGLSSRPVLGFTLVELFAGDASSSFSNYGITPVPAGTGKKITVIRGDLGTAGQAGAESGAQNFVDEANAANHTAVLIDQNASEQAVIDAMNNSDLVIIHAHGGVLNGNSMAGGRAATRGAMKDDRGNWVESFTLNGTGHLSPTERNVGVSALRFPVPANWVTSGELQGRINNPELVVVAAACDAGSNGAMANAIRGKHFIGCTQSVSSPTAAKHYKYAAEFLNGGHDNAVQAIGSNSDIAIDPPLRRR